MKYRYQAVKMAVILICVLAAGVCYSCDGRQDGWESGELPVMNAPGDAGTSRAEDAPEGNGEPGDSDPYGNAKNQMRRRSRFQKRRRFLSVTYISAGKLCFRVFMRWKRGAGFSR